MAAVGSNGSLINLMVNVFIGLSIGANVLVARYYGARDEKNLEETVHTAMVIAVVGGLLLIAVGELLTKPILILMGSPEDVLPLAVLYMKIYFLGMPGTLVYNFGSAILRAVGDTRRPLYFLLTAGVVNVIFNLIFVIAFSMLLAVLHDAGIFQYLCGFLSRFGLTVPLSGALLTMGLEITAGVTQCIYWHLPVYFLAFGLGFSGVCIHLQIFSFFHKAGLPLSKKLSEPATELYHKLQKRFMCDYDEAGSIGKRYRRQDEIGTPYCVTFDFDSATDGCVTVRDRDSMQQERIPMEQLEDYIAARIRF